MKNYIIIILITLSHISNSYSQNIWNKYPMDDESWHLVSELSLDSIKTIILNDDISASSRNYAAAVKYIFYFHKDSLSQFLLDNLNTEIDTSLSFPENLFEWNKIYIDTYIRGLLGDISMIDRMKIIANEAIGNPKSEAIRRLAEAGLYEHYEYVKNEFLTNSNIMYGFAIYGRDNRYSDEIKNLLTAKAYSSNSSLEVMGICSYLNYIPKAGTDLLDEFFKTKIENERFDYFRELQIIDKDGQPERSMYALVHEENDSLRAEYIPDLFKLYELNWISKKYVEPLFVNFLNTLNIPDTNSATYQVRKYFLQTYTPINPDSTTATYDIIKDLYNYVHSVRAYNWLGDLAFPNELKNILTTSKTSLQNGDSLACRVQVKTFQGLVDNVYKDSLNTDPRFVTIEGWKFLYWNAQYILDRLPEPPANPNLVVSLKSSTGALLTNGTMQYYEGSWKDVVNNGDGTFTVITTRPTVSIRVFYEYASQQVDNVTAENNTYTFTTVNAAVQLKNSLGNFIDIGTVQYYTGAWRNFGTTSNGVAYKELLPINYSFRMTYEFVSKDKEQNLGINPVVDFSTVLCSVKVSKTSNNQPINNAAVKYYSGAWRNLGTTNSSGIATKELLPVNLSFRATYGNVSLDKQQDISVNNLVEILLNVP